MNTGRWATLLLATVLLLTFPVAAAGTTSAPTPTGVDATNTITDIPVTGTLANGGTFRGVLDLIRFRVVDGQLVAIGELNGVVRNAAGDVVFRVVDQRVRLPVSFGSITSCDILRLRLGPLDLDLLGLVIHLDRIVLDITAEAGPGNLLGNLLCAIAGLLDGGLDLDGILANLLNAILGILRL